VRTHQAVGQLKEVVSSVLCPKVALDVGSSGAEHENGTGLTTEKRGGKTGVVTGAALVLFVCPLVLFVDHYECEVRLRRE
jgi:hypothetical protein